MTPTTAFSRSSDALEVHTDGSAYVLLDRGNPVDFGAVTIDAPEEEDTLLARFSADGDVLWSSQITGEGPILADSLALDEEGRATVAGSFLISVELGSELHENTFPYEEQNMRLTRYDVYVARSRPTGPTLGARPMGT